MFETTPASEHPTPELHFFFQGKTMSTNPKSDRRGFALPAMLLLIVVLSLLGTVSLATTDHDRSAASATLESQRAFYAAEAGIGATLELWNQSYYDGALPAPGDSTVIGWTAVENRCDYRVVVRRVDGDRGRAVYSITSTGRGPSLRGGQRTASLMVREEIVLPGNAVTMNGALEISGNPTIQGACGNTHVNGSPFQINGTVNTGGTVSGTGNVTVGGNLEDLNGNPVSEVDNADPQPIPDLDPLRYCNEADYWLRNGYIVRVAQNDSLDIDGSTGYGWKYSGTIYSTDNNNPASGTICADDDIEVGNPIGSSLAPKAMTLISSKSITIPGNPYLVVDHSMSILMMAGGDLKINGNGNSGANNYDGILYADAQCEISGTPNIHGMLVCRDASNPAGSEDWVSDNSISGDAEITYNCGMTNPEYPVTPLNGRAWSQVLD